MSKHTRGPWHLFEGGESIRDCRLLIGNNPAAPTVALICTEAYASAGDNLGREEALANARLIAAAPEMYEALKWAVEYTRKQLAEGCHFKNLDTPHWDAALAAIAKAEGQP